MQSRPAGLMPFPDNNRHLFHTVGPRCCAAIIPSGAAPIDREQAAPPCQTSKLYENLFELPRVRIQRAIGPHNEIGAGNFLFNRPLRGQALLDLLRRPPPTPPALSAGVVGGGGGAEVFFLEG